MGNTETGNVTHNVRLTRAAVAAILACLCWLGILIAHAWYAPLFMDEYSFLKNVAHFARNRTIIPVYARYPTLYSYLIAPFIYVAFAVRSILDGGGLAALKDATWLRFMFIENVLTWAWVARLVTMSFSVATLALVLWTVAKRVGLWAGMIAALLLALEPTGSFLLLSRWGLPDIPVAFLVTVVMLLAVRYTQRPDARILSWAAFLAGLAGSMKLNGVFGVFPLLAVPLLVDIQPRERMVGYARVIGFMLLGFLAGSPVFLISLKTYAAGFAAEREILTGGGHFGAHDRNWSWIARDLWKGNAVVALLLAFGVFRCLWRRSKADIVYLALLLPVVLIVGALAKKTMWYLMLLYPWSVVVVAEGIGSALSRIRPKPGRIAARTVLLLLLLLSGTGFVRSIRAQVRPDNRTIARGWIHVNIPSGAGIFMDWAYVPTLRDENDVAERLSQARQAGSPYVEKMAAHYQKTPTYRIGKLLTLGHNWSTLRDVDAAYLVTSESVYARFLVSDESKMPPEGDPMRARFMHARRFYTDLVEEKQWLVLVRSFDTGSGSAVQVFGRE